MRIAALWLLAAIATPSHAEEGAADVLGRIFLDEAGHWEGDCVQRTPDGVARMDARFEIFSDATSTHRFRGHYGDAAVSGRSEIVDGERVDHLDGAPAPERARILLARRTATDDYRYVVWNETARTTVTRLGPRQVLVLEPLDETEGPARICTYLRTDP